MTSTPHIDATQPSHSAGPSGHASYADALLIANPAAAYAIAAAVANADSVHRLSFLRGATQRPSDVGTVWRERDSQLASRDVGTDLFRLHSHWHRSSPSPGSSRHTPWNPQLAPRRRTKSSARE